MSGHCPVENCDCKFPRGATGLGEFRGVPARMDEYEEQDQQQQQEQEQQQEQQQALPKVKILQEDKFYLLIWKDETAYRTSVRLFRTEEEAIKSGYDEYIGWGDDLLESEKTIESFYEHKVFPKSGCDTGFGYFQVLELSGNQKVFPYD